MAFIPAVDTARVSMHFTQAGQQLENVFYVQSVASWDETSLNALGLIIEAWWTTSMASFISDTVTLVEIVLRDMTTDTGVEVVYTGGLPTPGTNSNAALPNNVTAAIKLLTALGGRSFRGRQYIIGLTQDSVSSDMNHLTPTAVTDLTIDYNALMTDIDATYTPGLVVASFYHGVDTDHKPIPRATAVLTAVTSLAFADDVLDSQRRRLPGRGR